MGGIGKVLGGGGSDGYVASPAPITTQNFASALSNSQNQFNNAFQGQGALAGMLMGQAQGVGPNPAQQMLNQTTDRNIQQNAGMIASQKGINPALAQRLAAQNAAQMGQQAAGQGALMGAQQQLGAEGQLGSTFNSMGSQSLGMNQNLQNAQAQQNNAEVGSTSNMNTTNAAAAGANAQEQGAVIGGLLGGAGAMGAAKIGQDAHGGIIKGKAQVSGDSPKNDTVPTMLSPGEIVIPRSVANDPEKAKEFIEHIRKQNEKKSNPDGPSFSKILQMHRQLGDALKKHGAV